MVMIRHVVLLKWKDGTMTEQRRQAVAAIRELPRHVETIRAFVVGEDAGLEVGTFDVVIVADFDDAAGYIAYRDHPVHRDLIQRLTDPIREARVALQYEWS